jgi:metallo-beta-lactamase class B
VNSFNISRPVLAWLLATLVPRVALAQQATTACKQCAEWNLSQKPFRVFGNTYYVGTHGLSSVLITSPAGHVLIDGDLSESARQIVEHIRTLGFSIKDVKFILNSHVHYDHAGGIAELQRLSGARVLASPWSASVLSHGGVGKGDPQRQIALPIARVNNVGQLHDEQVIRIGDVSIQAHFTPGHTPGGTSWTWQSCEGGVCHAMVYADSVIPVSADGFRFTDSREYPRAIADFEKSFAFFEGTRCDVIVTAHPEGSDLFDRLAARENGTKPDPMVNPAGCRKWAEHGRELLKQRVAEERGEHH